MSDDILFPLRNLQFRSTVNADKTLRISLDPVEMSRPLNEEVVVRVEAAPVNPSDLGLMLGGVPAEAFRPCGDEANPAMSASMSDDAFARLESRIGQALPVGLEGMGKVIAAGPQAAQLVGRKVSMFGYGSYSLYHKIAARDCIVLPDEVTLEAGAAAYVNPITALAMIETMRRDGHKAIVHTAAASNLGQMLVRICNADGIRLVNVVRSSHQVQLLKDIGARFICNSSSPTFAEELVQAIRETGATLAFDAVGGGDLASRILAAMEEAASFGDAPYSRYGSTLYKHVYVYGGFDPSPLVLHKNFGLAWGVSGWLLMPMLNKFGAEAVRAMKARVVRELNSTFASTFGHSISLADLFAPGRLVTAAARSTGGKFLIQPNAVAGNGA